MYIVSACALDTSRAVPPILHNSVGGLTLYYYYYYYFLYLLLLYY